MNILIVDDDVLLGRSLERVLRRLGHTVRATTSIERALALLARERPNLLITDVSLGEAWDGVDLACWAAYAYGTPVVVMTGGDHARARERLLRAGLVKVAVLPKPVSLEGLLDEVAWNDHDRTEPAFARGN